MMPFKFCRPLLMFVIVCFTYASQQGFAQDLSTKIKNAGRNHYQALLKTVADGRKESATEFRDQHYSQSLTKTLGAERSVRSVQQLQWELAGGTVHKSRWKNQTTFQIEFRDCQVGPAMTVELTIDEEAPHRITKVLGHAELAPRGKPLGERITAEALETFTIKLIDDFHEMDEFSGAVLVKLNGKVVVRRAVGMAEKRWSIENTPDTRFNTASMAKMFTAATVVRLVQQGKLSLDDTPGKYVEELKDHRLGNEITIRQLLTHTSGMGSFWTGDFFRDKASIRDVSDLLPYYKDQPLRFSPGERFGYSNSGFALLGLVVERACEKPFADVVNRLVFEPAGMDSTGWYDVDDPSIKSLATGYTYRPAGSSQPFTSGGRRFSNMMIIRARGGPAGGAYTTVDDLSRFAIAMKNKKILDDKHLELALKSHVETPFGRGREGESHAYGFGFSVGKSAGRAWWGHDGGAEGISTSFRHYPAENLTIVVLSNYDNGGSALASMLFSAIAATK